MGIFNASGEGGEAAVPEIVREELAKDTTVAQAAATAAVDAVDNAVELKGIVAAYVKSTNDNVLVMEFADKYLNNPVGSTVGVYV